MSDASPVLMVTTLMNCVICTENQKQSPNNFSPVIMLTWNAKIYFWGTKVENGILIPIYTSKPLKFYPKREFALQWELSEPIILAPRGVCTI